MRAYNYTCTRQVQATTYPGYTRTQVYVHTQKYKGTPVHVQVQAPVYTNQLHRSGCPYRTLYKHKHSRTLRASLRLSMPNTVLVQAQCVRTITSTHVHYVRRPGCPCHILYMYTYSVRAQARGPTHNRCIAQAVHAKHCTSTSTVRTYKHKHSCTLRTPPRLSMPYTVHVHVQRAHPSTRAYAQSVHRPGCPCQTLHTHVHVQCIHPSMRAPVD